MMSSRACLVGIVIVMGCASSRRAGAPTCEQDCVDAGIDASPDAKRKDFGEPCTDNKQCESELCILVGTTGQCTKLCGDCPAGYSCLGVHGIPIEGQVSFVCVPSSSQLCTPCTVDSECTLIGMDKCVTYPDGDRTCSRDCTTVDCPVGYGCEDVPIGGVNYRQCIPTSGACDCTASNPGQMQPCNIPTPFGTVCIGAQTCGGASGWGTCTPPSATDDPDDTYTDSNCDGIDGDVARAIFVSPAGADVPACGISHDMPCATLPYAISRAQTTGRPHVYAQAGAYNTGATLDMRSGISIFGGYSATWRRNSHTQAGHAATITGGVTGVRFAGLAAATRLDNVVIQSTTATGAGQSSVGVLVTSSTSVVLSNVRVTPGNGGPGSGGGNGTVGTAGGDGGIGTRGCENSDFPGCRTCSIPDSGVFGDSACGMVGGNGGWPGLNHDGGFGGEGGAGGTAAGAGAPCGDSRSCDGFPGDDGANGTVGTHGMGGGSFGLFVGAAYVAANGTGGVVGNPGNGGGGGGGGGGGDDGCDSYGSSGGGGGGGGCGGTAGSEGTGGGGSFGVIALDSLVVIDDSLVQSGTGGTGGPGGSGGGGGLGGAGGPGGVYGAGAGQDDAGDGGPGGRGGQGGRGGDGGGGGGGPSIAVTCLGTSASRLTVPGSTLANGSGGAGGSSGAPGATGTSARSFNCSF